MQVQTLSDNKYHIYIVLLWVQRSNTSCRDEDIMQARLLTKHIFMLIDSKSVFIDQEYHQQ